MQAGTLTSRLAAVLAVLTVLALSAGAHTACADQGGMTLDIQLDLQRDGVLAVTATIAASQDTTDRMALDIPVEGNRIQHFQVSAITATGGAQAKVAGRDLVVSAPSGTSTVSFTVQGTVADSSSELQQFTWLLAAGWSAPIDTLTGRFRSPTAAPDSPICGYGQIGERRLCSLTQTDGGTVTFQNNQLQAGSVAVFSVLLPAGTVAATAQFTPNSAGTTVAAPPARDAAGLLAVAAAVVLALMLTGFGWLRRRADDAGAHSAGTTAELLVPQGNRLAFASPDGVLPGQIGTLTTGRARPADIGATVLDLAIRNYLGVAELPRSSGLLDFQISRRAPLDDAVTEFERAVLNAVLPDDRESVTASELTQRAVDLEAPRASIVSSVVEQGWLRRDRRWELAGFALLSVGAVAAACLALVGSGVLWAVAVAVLGGGVAGAARLLPSRTTSGSRLAAAVCGMRQYLTVLAPGDVEAAARPVLFQRAIPYAHSLGELRGWLRRWGVGPATPVEWFRPAGDRPALAGLPVLAAMLDGVAAQSEAVEER